MFKKESESNVTVIKRVLDTNKRKVEPLIITDIVVDMIVNRTLYLHAFNNIESATRITYPNVFLKAFPQIYWTRNMREVIRTII